MRKSFILILCFAFFCGKAIAKDVATAKRQAEWFYTQKVKPVTRNAHDIVLELAYTGKEDQRDTYYVFNGADGFVIVSAYDENEPIIAFSDKGIFDYEKSSPALQWLLSQYGRNTSKTKKSAPNFTRGLGADIAPLIQTQWDQIAPFNNLCPDDPNTGQKCLTGCIATAMAQLMYYYQWPERGSSGHSYEWNGQYLSADFDVEYQWNKMKTKYDYNNVNDDIDNAVSTLMWHCGVAAEMQYGSSFSAATFSCEKFMSTYFGYTRFSKSVWKNPDDEFEKAIYESLSGDAPVLVCGQDENRGYGHVFICDGYQDGGYFHFNWGWNGFSDGFFLLSAMSTSDGNFDTHLQAICNLVPQKSTIVDGVVYEIISSSEAIVSGAVSDTDDVIIAKEVSIDGQLYSVTSIAPGAFANCSQGRTYFIPNSINRVGERAFYDVTNATIIIEDGDTDLVCEHSPFESSFYEFYIGRPIKGEMCISTNWIEYVRLGSGLTEIPDALLEYYISCMELPATFEVFDDEARVRAARVEGFTVNSSNTVFSAKDGVLFDKEMKTLLYYPIYRGNTEYTIPLSVTRIEKKAFERNESLQKLTILEEVTSIGEEAFGSLNNLKYVEIKCTTPPVCEDNALTGLYNAEIEVPFRHGNDYKNADGWKDLPNIKSQRLDFNDMIFAEKEDGSLEIIKVYKTGDVIIYGYIYTGGEEIVITSIGDYAFSENSNVTSVTIPATITSIGEHAFYDCPNLKSFIISEAEEGQANLPLVFTGVGMFDGCNIEYIYQGRDVQDTWGIPPFSELETPKKVVIGGMVTILQERSYDKCSGITSLTFEDGDSDLIIEKSVFNFSGLEELYIGRNIPECSCFLTSYGLKTIGIGKNVTSLDWLPTSNPELICINVDNDNSYYCSDNGVLYNKDQTVLLLYPAQKTDLEYKVLETVTDLANKAFQNQNIIKKLILPASLTNIGINVFYMNENLDSLYVLSKTPPTCDYNGIFYLAEQSPLLKIFVPEEGLDAYKTADQWSLLKDRIYSIESLGINRPLLSESEIKSVYTTKGIEIGSSSYKGVLILRKKDGSTIKIVGNVK